jgi:hypothetical protein
MAMMVCALKGREEHGKRDVVDAVLGMDNEMGITNRDSNRPTQRKQNSSAPLQ